MTSPGRARKGMSAREAIFPHFYVGVVSLDVMTIVDAIARVISNVGFPIACVVAMFYMWEKERQEHKVESEKFVEAINNNTTIMQKLVDQIECRTK